MPNMRDWPCLLNIYALSGPTCYIGRLATNICCAQNRVFRVFCGAYHAPVVFYVECACEIRMERLKKTGWRLEDKNCFHSVRRG